MEEDVLKLPPAPEGEEIVFDYASLGLTLRRHPLALLRPRLAERRMLTALQLESVPNGRPVRYCGIVTLRQQPETANSTVFVSLEDETGVVQVVCWRSLRERQRTVLLRARLGVRGIWQRQGGVASLVAGWLEDLTPAARAAGDAESQLPVTTRRACRSLLWSKARFTQTLAGCLKQRSLSTQAV